MKQVLVLAACLLVIGAMAQKYPEPEYTNEIYYLDKDSSILVRLEKGTSKMDTKMKMAGIGGAESGYEMDGGKSVTRLKNRSNLSFIYSNGSTAASNAKRDSMMRAHGGDPEMMHSMMEPSNMISLYKAETGKDKRKVLMMKSGGANPFASNKNQSSDKFTFSAKKIREGYWELLVDKTLPKGEYIFTMMNMSMSNADGSMLLFAFAVE